MSLFSYGEKSSPFPRNNKYRRNNWKFSVSQGFWFDWFSWLYVLFYNSSIEQSRLRRKPTVPWNRSVFFIGYVSIVRFYILKYEVCYCGAFQKYSVALVVQMWRFLCRIKCLLLCKVTTPTKSGVNDTHGEAAEHEACTDPVDFTTDLPIRSPILCISCI